MAYQRFKPILRVWATATPLGRRHILAAIDSLGGKAVERGIDRRPPPGAWSSLRAPPPPRRLRGALAHFGQLWAGKRVVGAPADGNELLGIPPCGRAVARERGSLRRAVHGTEAVRFLLERRFVLAQRLGWTAEFDQPVA